MDNHQLLFQGSDKKRRIDDTTDLNMKTPESDSNLEEGEIPNKNIVRRVHTTRHRERPPRHDRVNVNTRYSQIGYSDGSRENAEYSSGLMRARLINLLGDEYKSYITEFRYDDESLFAVTKLSIGKLICRVLMTLGVPKDATITDAFAGIGGNTLMFASMFEHVTAVEISRNRTEMLIHNIKLFGLSKYISVYSNYYQSIMYRLTQDVVFFDPPWGSDYKTRNKVRLSVECADGSYTSIEDLIINIAPNTKYIVVKLPYSYDFNHLCKCTNMIAPIQCIEDFYRPFSCRIVYMKVAGEWELRK